MVQSLQLQSQQSRGDFHHFVHLRIILPIVFFPGFHISKSNKFSQMIF